MGPMQAFCLTGSSCYGNLVPSQKLNYSLRARLHKECVPWEGHRSVQVKT